MSTTYYSLYIQDVMTLAKSLVIKSDIAAQTMNTELQGQGYEVDSEDPRTWKYYLNLAGRYHSADQMMTVTSLDTLETIEFTQANLRIHRATAKAYQIGTRQYRQLVERYTDPTDNVSQEALIQGIINPIDLDTALAAGEGDILFMDPNLVEPQEANLKEELQGYIHRFMIRWHNQAYVLTDDLYLPTHLGIMALNIPLWIMNIRLQNCKTLHAHTFHIREYLTSHGRLDRFMEHMTIKQQLWLYRNILYLENNAGKQETFDWLVENLLTDRGLPLAQYDMRHNLTSLSEKFTPTVEFKRSAVNRHYSPGITELRTLDQVLDDEDSLAPRNPEVWEQTYQSVTDTFTTSRYTHLPTKVLDSSITDLSDAGVITLSSFLINHWMHWGSTLRYTSVLSIEDPRSGETWTLPAREAFLLYLYAYNRSVGVTMGEIPQLMAHEVRKDRLPTLDALKGLCQSRYVSEDELLTALDDNPTLPRQVVSTVAFQEAVAEVYDRALGHYFQYACKNHRDLRGQLQAACDHFYQDIVVFAPEAGQSYPEWLKRFNLPILDYTQLEMETLATRVIAEATGVDISNRRTLKEIQGAMLGLMARLSSYSIQFVQKINPGPILVTDMTSVRPGDQQVSVDGAWTMDFGGQEILSHGLRHYETWTLVPDCLVDLNIDMKAYLSLDVDASVDMELLGLPVISQRVNLGAPDIDFVDPPADNWHIVPV